MLPTSRARMLATMFTRLYCVKSFILFRKASQYPSHRDWHLYGEQAAFAGSCLEDHFARVEPGPFINMGKAESLRSSRRVEALAVVGNGKPDARRETVEGDADVDRVRMADDVLQLFLRDAKQSQLPVYLQQLNIGKVVVGELDMTGGGVTDIVHQSRDLADQADLVEGWGHEAA